MMQKLAIVTVALSAVACFVMFFVLRQTPPQEMKQSPKPPYITMQLDTAVLGGITPCDNGIIAGNKRGELRIFSLNAAEVEPQEFPLSKHEISAPVLDRDGTCFVGDVNGMFWAFDRMTGTVKWSYKTGNQIIGQAAWHDNKVFVGSHDCDFYAWDSETGERLFTVECGAQINAAAVVSERSKAIFFGNCDGLLRKIDIVSGTLTGSIDMGSPIPENIAMYDETLYILAHQGELTAVDCERFEITYQVKTPNEYLSSPYATESFLFLTEAKGNIHVHSRKDGTRLTTLTTSETMTPLQAGDDLRVFAVSTRGKLYMWQREGDSWHESLLADLQTDCRQSAVLTKNRLFVADESGGLFYVEVSP